MGHAELEPADIDTSISAFHGALRRTWNAFCATTTVHGLKFTRDEETSRIARFIWVLITLVMLCCAIVMVHTFYVDYRSNPTRLHVENDYAPVTSLFFPAVTICPEVLYNMHRAKRFINTLKLPDGINTSAVIEGLRFDYGFIRDDESFKPSDVAFMQEILSLNQLTITKFTEGLRWHCEDFMLRCRYRWRIEDCTELFQISRTFVGHCCSFNLQQHGLNFTARYARPGWRDGLSIIVYYSEGFDLIRSYSHGFKVMLHENFAYPSAHTLSKFVPLNEEVTITIRPEETFCSAAVRHMPQDERQCVFPDEMTLKYFDRYESSHCILNCRVTNMVKFCGCMTFFFADNTTKERICTYTDVPCLVENFTDIIGRFRNTQCSCPNDCETFSFDMELSSAKLALDVPTISTFYEGIGKDYSVIHIHFASSVYRRVRRDLLSNTVSLVSNLGSAFSLFIGVSMVSIVEIIYYFTVILRKFYGQEQRARDRLLSQQHSAAPVLE